MEAMVSTAAATATTASVMTSVAISSTKRLSSKIAKIQGYVVRGVTAAKQTTDAEGSTGSIPAFNTSSKRGLLRVVRPTVASRSGGMLGRTSVGITHHKTPQQQQPTYYSHANTVNSGATTTLSDWRGSTSGDDTTNNWMSSFTELFNSTTWRDPTTYLNSTGLIPTVTNTSCILNSSSSVGDVRVCQDDYDANGTYHNGTAIGDEDEAKNFWALLLFLFPLLTVIGNVLVILSVYRERALQTATNYFIISLAIADLLVATVVMPFAVYVTVSLKCSSPLRSTRH